MGNLSDHIKYSADVNKFKASKHRDVDKFKIIKGVRYTNVFILKVRSDANHKHISSGAQIKISTIAKKYKIPLMHARKMKGMNYEDLID